VFKCVFIHVFYAVHTAAGTDDHGSEVRSEQSDSRESRVVRSRP
jgi:hypothetical protein